ncbi:STAS domain-containing protein [Marilutibacter maris]|uniref:Anti-sigma B factor antagonist n=1 Tax=Marilutibacter maris TaxID=1605891 RepID=A0A2U9T046_9GAMM|nr:STAS domain-containing protein [Lysobacter maris]AWV05793.1 anti-sigma B factor antagonist [Lysobacter maris]
MAAAAATATVRRDGDALVFDGALVREACAALWRLLQPLLAGARRIDLEAVTAIDSAGLALLAEVAARAGIDTVTGTPPGLPELRAAYRLDTGLGYGG